MTPSEHGGETRHTRPSDPATSWCRELRLRSSLEDILACAVEQIVAVLDRGNRKDGLRGPNVLNRHLAKAGVADRTVVEEVPDRRERLVTRNGRIDPVHLPQCDTIHAQDLPAAIGSADQIVRITVRLPLVRSRTFQTGLGRDVDVSTAMQRPDRLLGTLRAVEICGVNEVDAQLSGRRRSVCSALSRSAGGPRYRIPSHAWCRPRGDAPPVLHRF